MLVCKTKNVRMLSYYQVKEDAGIASHWKKDAGIASIKMGVLGKHQFKERAIALMRIMLRMLSYSGCNKEYARIASRWKKDAGIALIKMGVLG